MKQIKMLSLLLVIAASVVARAEPGPKPGWHPSGAPTGGFGVNIHIGK
jgi:hypothetical protein